MSDPQSPDSWAPRPPALRPLAHPVGVLYEIRWGEICPWLILVKSLRVTLLVRVLVMAFLGVLIAQWGANFIDGLFSTETASISPLGTIESPELIPTATEHLSLGQPISSPLLRGWQWVVQPFVNLATSDGSWQTCLRFLVQGIWMIVVWAIFGGTIVRMTAQYLTRGETIGPLVSIQDAVTIWPSTVGAPIIALLAAIALAVPLVVLGFVIRLNVAAVVAGLLWCVVLAWGVMLAVVLVGLLIGWPLMWACLGVERSDAFDGVSRCYAYVYQRPLQLLFYVAVSIGLAWVGEAVINFFATSSVAIAEWTLSWGTGAERAEELFGSGAPNSAGPLAERAIATWKWAMESLAEAFALASLWSFATGIYLLMRRHVDSTEMEEITLSDGTQPSGLPKLGEQESDESKVGQSSTDDEPSASED